MPATSSVILLPAGSGKGVCNLIMPADVCIRALPAGSLLITVAVMVVPGCIDTDWACGADAIVGKGAGTVAFVPVVGGREAVPEDVGARGKAEGC